MGVRGEGKGGICPLGSGFFLFWTYFRELKVYVNFTSLHTHTYARSHARTHLPLPGKIPAGAPDSHIQAIKLFS